jgi:hypothetical protein
MNDKIVYAMRVKGFQYEILGLIDSIDDLNQKDNRITIHHPSIVQITAADKESGVLKVNFIPVQSPYANKDAQSIQIFAEDITFGYPVKQDMESEFRSTFSNIITPNSGIIAS